MVLSSKPHELGVFTSIKIAGGGLSNDANHISGPSRTGMELGLAVRQALGEARKTSTAIDFISAHGTATVFNDEMEAKAFYALGMENIPLNSLKGYFGHTLGAAGVVETIMSMHSLLHNEVLASKGFDRLGVSQPINVCKEPIKMPLTTCLKTASGFGGCNAAIVLQKENY
jgi:3-oxoacyl-[acyl-carrier-protein] synthase-1